MSEQQQPVFSIEKIYVKDISLESPNSPHCFLERDPAQIEVQIATTGTGVGDGTFEVVLTVTVTAKIGDKTQFLAEAAQAGIFVIQGIPNEEIEPIVAVACPNILFPYARETISDVVNRAGFPQVLLAPVNFENIYRQRLEAEQGRPAEAPIQ
ncbi:MAG: protein-export chaperone SecB [Gammaproteobacteria bacterium]|nr:protein-export chaperone SecB [Gammaproteobacteria bacterium]MBU1645888.1 protein-export chaperone SecB [Gammaproteobacteria bacterium]MBU1971950.1 protein-export chaperone SecB [Gammaproteobacteria bacterium]